MQATALYKNQLYCDKWGKVTQRYITLYVQQNLTTKKSIQGRLLSQQQDFQKQQEGLEETLHDSSLIRQTIFSLSLAVHRVG